MARALSCGHKVGQQWEIRKGVDAEEGSAEARLLSSVVDITEVNWKGFVRESRHCT